MRLHQNMLENLGCPNYTHATVANRWILQTCKTMKKLNWLIWEDCSKTDKHLPQSFVWELCQRTKNSFSCRSRTDNALLAEELTGIYWPYMACSSVPAPLNWRTCNGFLWFSRQYKGKVLAHQNWMTPPKVATWKVFSVFLCDIYPPFLKTNIYITERGSIFRMFVYQLSLWLGEK